MAVNTLEQWPPAGAINEKFVAVSSTEDEVPDFTLDKGRCEMHTKCAATFTATPLALRNGRFSNSKTIRISTGN